MELVFYLLWYITFTFKIALSGKKNPMYQFKEKY